MKVIHILFVLLLISIMSCDNEPVTFENLKIEGEWEIVYTNTGFGEIELKECRLTFNSDGTVITNCDEDSYFGFPTRNNQSYNYRIAEGLIFFDEGMFYLTIEDRGNKLLIADDVAVDGIEFHLERR